MPHYLSDDELKRTAPAEVAAYRGPVPTQIVSNGEYNPLPQTREQRRVEARVKELAADLAPRHGLSRRQFLTSSAGMAAAFLAMNDVFGPVFDVSRAEAATPGVAAQRAQALAGQYIVDAQTHFVRDDFKQEGLLDLAKYAKQNWNPDLWGENTLARYKFENYVKEIFVDSDTKVALLSGAPFDDSSWDLLTNDQIAAARTAVNRISGSRRLLGHAVFTPKKQGLDGGRGPRDRDPQARQLEGLHHRRSPLSLQARVVLVARRRQARVPLLREGREVRHHDHLHPQGPAAGRLRDVVARRLGVRDRQGRRQGGQGLAEDQLRHVPRGAPCLPGEARRGARRVRADGAHQVGDRPRRDSGQARREERLRRGGHGVRDVRRRESALRRGLHRHARQGASASTTSSGAPTRSGTGRPSGRSRRCAGSRSPRTCRRSTASSRWARPTDR